MNKEAAVRLVNGWIESYRLYLKDGGGAAGVHPIPKQALIDKIAEAFEQVRIVMAPSHSAPPPPAKRGRGRPVKVSDDG